MKERGYSFIRQQNTIQTNFTFSECLQANYIAFQNPDYANTWFFAFIDDVIYKSDACTEIKYTLDVWSCYYGYWQAKSCFVEREHTNDDTIGANTVNENLNVGGVIEEDTEQILGGGNNFVVVETTYNVGLNRDYAGVTVLTGNVASSLFYIFEITQAGLTSLNNFFTEMASDNKLDSILNMYILPYEIIMNMNRITDVEFPMIDTNLSTNIAGSIDISHPFSRKTSYSDYTPKNNKCFVYPYNYLLVSNNVNNNLLLKYEDFKWNVDTNILLIELAFAIGGSIRLVPTHHKNINKNYDESLPLAKFPTCSWSADSFTNWLTANAVNITTKISELGVNLATGNVAGGTAEIASLIGDFYNASLLPSITGGNNTGDVNFASGNNCFTLHYMRAKTEYLRIIDDYFSRFGYKTLRNKVPNLSGRQNFNYVKIASDENIGNGAVPSKFMDIINNIFRRGVTIWHNHENLGDYSVSNNII